MRRSGSRIVYEGSDERCIGIEDMLEYRFTSPPDRVAVDGLFDSSCILRVAEASLASLNSQRLRLKISRMGDRLRAVANNSVVCGAVSGSITIQIGADGTIVEISDNVEGAFDLRLWRKSKIVIGPNSTSNGTEIICADSEVVIGEDCMFSSHVTIQSSDQHGIVDLKTRSIVNSAAKRVTIGNHVWLGRRALLLPDISVGSGSIIGAGSVVINNVPENCIAVGVPAKVVREDATWSRSQDSLDQASKEICEKFAGVR